MARICVPVCVARVGELSGAIRSAAEVADIIELRLDYLPETELNNSIEEISRLGQASTRPLILTLRPSEQGGHRQVSMKDRCGFRASIAPAVGDNDFRDTELDLALQFAEAETSGKDLAGWGLGDWNRTICSHHDFLGVPSDINEIYARMAATKARILKIAVQADEVTDCLPILRLLDRAKREGREFIGIAMGPAGALTRILGPSRGSYLTYGSLDDETATAPGQLTAKELREVYRIDQIDSQTEIFGIVGNPISQSLSPYIHNAAFAAAGRNAVYLPFQVRDVQRFVQRMVHPKTRELDWNLRGLSVTIPHKSAVMSSLDSVDDAAKRIGAVNTIIVRDDQLFGYNTDAAGFISPLRERFGSLADARCAVMGAGGAARAAVWALKNSGAEVTLFGRDIRKTSAVAAGFGVPGTGLSGADFSAFDIVINATPLGMSGANQEATPATSAQLNGVRLAYDLVYNPSETKFLIEARNAGCETLGGIEMLVAQAIEQYRLWLGSGPPEEAMINAATIAMKTRAKEPHTWFA